MIEDITDFLAKCLNRKDALSQLQKNRKRPVEAVEVVGLEGVSK